MAQEVAGAERRALALNDALKAGGAAKVDTIEHLNAIRQMRRNGRELHRSGVLFRGDRFFDSFPAPGPARPLVSIRALFHVFGWVPSPFPT